MSAIAPTYLAGKNGSVYVTAGGSAASLPITGWKTAEKVGTFDCMTPASKGYDDVEAAERSCTFSFDCLWKKTGGAPPVVLGSIYPFQLNTQQASGGTGSPVFEGFSGNALVTAISTTSNIKGETMYTGEGQFKGVYDSPDYPTAIADAASSSGAFAPPT